MLMHEKNLRLFYNLYRKCNNVNLLRIKNPVYLNIVKTITTVVTRKTESVSIYKLHLEQEKSSFFTVVVTSCNSQAETYHFLTALVPLLIKVHPVPADDE